LFEKPGLRKKMGQAGYRQVQNGQGAVDRTLKLIESLITEEAG